ncbi:MAG: single-stranded DNA-binding protein [Actinomycetales bacterium]|nr:single-stranded DNA-binding protein [Actinomycetales bacterium]
MSNEIEVTVQGYVGKDPTLKKSDGKADFVQLRIGSTPRVRNREDGQWADGSTQWFSVKFWGEFAVNVAASVRRGDSVVVRGRLQHEEYITEKGEERWNAVILANAFGPDLKYAIAHPMRVRRETEVPSEGPLDVNGYEVVEDEETPEGAEEDDPISIAARISAGV